MNSDNSGSVRIASTSQRTLSVIIDGRVNTELEVGRNDIPGNPYQNKSEIGTPRRITPSQQRHKQSPNHPVNYPDDKSIYSCHSNPDEKFNISKYKVDFEPSLARKGRSVSPTDLRNNRFSEKDITEVIFGDQSKVNQQISYSPGPYPLANTFNSEPTHTQNFGRIQEVNESEPSDNYGDHHNHYKGSPQTYRETVKAQNYYQKHLKDESQDRRYAHRRMMQDKPQSGEQQLGENVQLEDHPQSQKVRVQTTPQKADENNIQQIINPQSKTFSFCAGKESPHKITPFDERLKRELLESEISAELPFVNQSNPNQISSTIHEMQAFVDGIKASNISKALEASDMSRPHFFSNESSIPQSLIHSKNIQDSVEFASFKESSENMVNMTNDIFESKLSNQNANPYYVPLACGINQESDKSNKRQRRDSEDNDNIYIEERTIKKFDEKIKNEIKATMNPTSQTPKVKNVNEAKNIKYGEIKTPKDNNTRIRYPQPKEKPRSNLKGKIPFKNAEYGVLSKRQQEMEIEQYRTVTKTRNYSPPPPQIAQNSIRRTPSKVAEASQRFDNHTLTKEESTFKMMNQSSSSSNYKITRKATPSPPPKHLQANISTPQQPNLAVKKIQFNIEQFKVNHPPKKQTPQYNNREFRKLVHSPSSYNQGRIHSQGQQSSNPPPPKLGYQNSPELRSKSPQAYGSGSPSQKSNPISRIMKHYRSNSFMEYGNFSSNQRRGSPAPHTDRQLNKVIGDNSMTGSSPNILTFPQNTQQQQQQSSVQSFNQQQSLMSQYESQNNLKYQLSQQQQSHVAYGHQKHSRQQQNHSNSHGNLLVGANPHPIGSPGSVQKYGYNFHQQNQSSVQASIQTTTAGSPLLNKAFQQSNQNPLGSFFKHTSSLQQTNSSSKVLNNQADGPSSNRVDQYKNMHQMLINSSVQNGIKKSARKLNFETQAQDSSPKPHTEYFQDPSQKSGNKNIQSNPINEHKNGRSRTPTKIRKQNDPFYDSGSKHSQSNTSRRPKSPLQTKFNPNAALDLSGSNRGNYSPLGKNKPVNHIKLSDRSRSPLMNRTRQKSSTDKKQSQQKQHPIENQVEDYKDNDIFQLHKESPQKMVPKSGDELEQLRSLLKSLENDNKQQKRDIEYLLKNQDEIVFEKTKNLEMQISFYKNELTSIKTTFAQQLKIESQKIRDEAISQMREQSKQISIQYQNQQKLAMQSMKEQYQRKEATLLEQQKSSQLLTSSSKSLIGSSYPLDLSFNGQSSSNHHSSSNRDLNSNGNSAEVESLKKLMDSKDKEIQMLKENLFGAFKKISSLSSQQEDKLEEEGLSDANNDNREVSQRRKGSKNVIITGKYSEIDDESKQKSEMIKYGDTLTPSGARVDFDAGFKSNPK